MIPKRPVLTPRLLLRSFRLDDAQDLFTYLSQPSVYMYEPGEPIPRDKAQTLAEQMAASPHFWAVELRAPAGDEPRSSHQTVIGQVYFQQTQPEHLKTWELGYILNPAYQRQGYMSEAAAALVDYGFSTGQIHRVVAHCSPDNTASWKLLEKIGFRREGLLRQNIFFRRNAHGEPLWMDSYAYARLEDDSTD